MTAALDRSRHFAVVAALSLLAPCSHATADGHVKAPSQYAGSLEERSQEAIIIFDRSTDAADGNEDLILKISVEGAVDRFAWVIPFPNPPAVHEADAKMFKELFDYVAYQLAESAKLAKGKKFGGGFGGGGIASEVEVLSRDLVGRFDVAVVKEKESGALNRWLDDEGFQRIENGEPIIEDYRRKNFVFACIKVSEAQSGAEETNDLHPLRFTFDTGGRDGIYFPMKLTGLQAEPFDVNLYVLSRRPLNANSKKYGYERRGFREKYRGDKPFPVDDSHVLTFGKFMTDVHPSGKFYLTNLKASHVDPASVRNWKYDLWLFPDYGVRFTPFDARRGGPVYSY